MSNKGSRAADQPRWSTADQPRFPTADQQRFSTADQPSWLTARQQRAWLGYRRMRTVLDLQLARDLSRDSGLSEPDYDVLSTLSESPDGQWRAGDLAARLSWSTSRLTHHATRMQNRGLVARQATAEDGRGAVICLTDDGWATLRAAAPPHVQSVRRHFIDLLTAEEVDTLTAITEKVLAGLTTAQEETPGPRDTPASGHAMPPQSTAL